MTLRRRALLALVGLVLARPPVLTLTEALTDADISRALAIASGGEAARVRFHAPYIIELSGPSVEQIEVVTEFRRFVLAAEEQVALGNWMAARGGYDQKGRTLKDILRPTTGQVLVKARIRFHPLNSYVDVPPLDIRVGEPSLLPLSVVRSANYALPAKEVGRPSPVTGAVIEAAFNAPSVGDRAWPVRVFSENEDLGGLNVDFSRLE